MADVTIRASNGFAEVVSRSKESIAFTSKCVMEPSVDKGVNMGAKWV